MSKEKIGQAAIRSKGWLAAHKWLILRRLSQISIMALFLIGPLFGVWLVKGNLTSSLTLNVLPLTDPYVLLQSFVAGHGLEKTALIGAVIVVVFYFLVGGRVYCSWVCPVNLVTDAANWAREKLGLRGGMQMSRRLRYWVLAMTLGLAWATASIAWELINPVSMLQRGLVFGLGGAWMIVLAVFLLDLFVSKRGWCGHLCPVGAFYNLLGRHSLVRVSAFSRDKCHNCMDCYNVCPEPQVITPALKGADKGLGPVILDANCTNCGRCVDVCSVDVFSFATRFQKDVLVEAKAGKEAGAT